MGKNQCEQINTELEKEIFDIYCQSIRQMPNVSINQQLIDNYKFFGARKQISKTNKNKNNIRIFENNEITEDSIYSEMSAFDCQG